MGEVSIGALNGRISIAGSGNCSLGIIDNYPARKSVEKFKSPTVTAKLGEHLLVTHHLNILVTTPGHGHDEKPCKALSYICKLYAIEKKIRNGDYSPEQIYEIRQAESKPILDDFKKWLKKKKQQTPPKGLLGKAVAYTLNQWHRLIGYIEDGNLSIDNNMAENSIRPFVVGRKNWLYSGTPEGAEASAQLYSLIETAKANKLEPWAYLRHIFDRLPQATTLEDYEALLLPWNVTREQLNLPAVSVCAL